MPKKTVATLPPDDVPAWDALVAELTDPRPYEPLEITTSYVVPDDAFSDAAVEFEVACAQLDRDVDDALSALDDVDRDAVDALNAIYEPPPPPSPPVRLRQLLRDVDATLVLPVWPATGDDDNDEDVTS